MMEKESTATEEENRTEEKLKIRLQNKSGRPDNVVRREFEIEEECEQIQAELPSFMKGFFAYMRQSLLAMSRLAYLHDIRFFCQYLIEQTDLTEAKEIGQIRASEFDAIRGSDVNRFIDYCRRYKVKNDDGQTVVYENNNKTLARKKSSLSVLFRYLYREEIVSKNITDQFDPIRIPRASDREIESSAGRRSYDHARRSGDRGTPDEKGETVLGKDKKER